MLTAASSGNLDVVNGAGRRQNWIAIFAHALDMELNGLANLAFNFVDTRTCSDTSGQIRDICREIGPGIFNNDGIAHGSPHLLKPACLRMLFKVPGASSSLGLPGTVTRPDLVGCLNCRWLPRVTTRYQPSSPSIRSISATFTDQLCAGRLHRPRARPNDQVERRADATPAQKEAMNRHVRSNDGMDSP